MLIKFNYPTASRSYNSLDILETDILVSNKLDNRSLYYSIDPNYTDELNCLESIYSPPGSNLEPIIPDKIASIYLEHKAVIPWEKTVNKYELIETLIKKKEKITNICSQSKSTNYLLTFLKNYRFLNRILTGINIKPNEIKNWKNIQRYNPGYKLNTLTGRMTVKSKPNVLNLKKEYRKELFVPNPGCKLCYVDFVSCEPKFLLNNLQLESGHDVYQSLIDMSDIDFDRNDAKLAYLIVIYGGSNELLQQKLGVRKANSVITSMKKLIDTSGLENRLRKDYYNTGYIKNVYGRPIYAKGDASDSKLLNHYVQSSAVDVTLQGFQQLYMSALKEDINLTADVVIHDGMYFSVKTEDVDRFNDLVDKGLDIPNMGKFYLSVENYE